MDTAKAYVESINPVDPTGFVLAYIVSAGIGTLIYLIVTFKTWVKGGMEVTDGRTGSKRRSFVPLLAFMLVPLLLPYILISQAYSAAFLVKNYKTAGKSYGAGKIAGLGVGAFRNSAGF